MANARRPGKPTPLGANRQPHGNVAPFSPAKLETVAPGGSVQEKGAPNSYFDDGPKEKGTGKEPPFWP